MQQLDVIPHTIRHQHIDFHVEIRTSASPTIAPVLAVRALAEREAAIGPQTKALLPLADIVSVRIGGVSAPGKLPPGSRLSDLADGLAGVLDELGLPRVNICGTSHGGEIAYQLALRHPDRTERVVLTGVAARPPALPRGTDPAGLSALMRSPARREVTREIIARLLCLNPARPVRGRATMEWVLNDMLATADEGQIGMWRRCLELLYAASQPSGLQPPLLAVTGEHDVASPTTECRALAAMSSQAVFATIAEADHWVFLTRSHELLDLTRRFLLDEPLEGLPYVAALERFNRQVSAQRSR
ncbi:alpha/beta fold hydrolase [Streptomyces sp. NPDC059564]|uniref:alpha/beta fold hydrolase n=1 Tax=Streptomyces sp. NPDC059564 TaxID=3346865 RepID=UPI003693278C